jgi:hypothetical protein
LRVTAVFPADPRPPAAAGLVAFRPDGGLPATNILRAGISVFNFQLIDVYKTLFITSARRELLRDRADELVTVLNVTVS